jgi:hypothetical protein
MPADGRAVEAGFHSSLQRNAMHGFENYGEFKNETSRFVSEKKYFFLIATFKAVVIMAKVT